MKQNRLIKKISVLYFSLTIAVSSISVPAKADMLSDLEQEMIIAAKEYDIAKMKYDDALDEFEEVCVAAESAKEKKAKGSYGFFEKYGYTEAMNVLKNQAEWVTTYTHVGNEEDATSLSNLKATVTHLKRCNQLRQAEGRDPLSKKSLTDLKVSMRLMAISEVQANWSTSNSGHIANSGTANYEYKISENLSKSFNIDSFSPFDGWYTNEKVAWNNAVSNVSTYPELSSCTAPYQVARKYNTLYYEVGHYLNIVDASNNATGFAVSGYGIGTTYQQSFSTASDLVSVNEFESMLNAYCQPIDAAINEYNIAKKIVGEKEIELDEKREEYVKAKIAYEDELELDNHRKGLDGGHDYTNQEYKTDVPGKHYMVCNICGDESEHEECTGDDKHSIVIESVKFPTCTEDGSYDEYYTCIKCKQIFGINTITMSAMGHLFVNYVSDNNATCLMNSTETAFCANKCGVKDIREIENTAIGHNYIFTKFDWNEDGSECYAVLTCDREDCHSEEEYAATITSEVKKAATCTERGITTYTATYETYTDSLDVDDIECDEDNHTFVNGVCDECGFEDSNVSPSPSIMPSEEPSVDPSTVPSVSVSPSISPSVMPSISPSVSVSPSTSPSVKPSTSPSVNVSPSTSPSVKPSISPSPSIVPSKNPSERPIIKPSPSDEVSISPLPSVNPSVSTSASIWPSENPSIDVSTKPSPSEEVSASPAPSNDVSASIAPSAVPSKAPSVAPSQIPQKQTIIVSKKASKTIVLKVKNLKKKKATFKIGAKAKTGLSYTLSKKAKKYITVSKSGKVTIKKGCKKGKYVITITARATSDYEKATKKVTIKVK